MFGFNVFNFAKIFRVHAIIRNANGTFVRIRYVREDGKEINLIGRTGVRFQGASQPMFRSPFHINFYKCTRWGDNGWRQLRVDRIKLIATVGRKEVVQGFKPHA